MKEKLYGLTKLTRRNASFFIILIIGLSFGIVSVINNVNDIKFAEASGSISGTMVLMDQSPLATHVNRLFYNWHSGYGKKHGSYACISHVEPAISFSLPGFTCDIDVTVCDSSGNVPYQKLFLDPGATNEIVGKGCNYIYATDWGCFTERFTGVSGGLHKVTIGTWGNLYYAGNTDWASRTADLNGCIIFDVPGHSAYENSDTSVNYLPKTHVRYYGYGNTYIPHLNYMSVAYSCN